MFVVGSSSPDSPSTPHQGSDQAPVTVDHFAHAAWLRIPAGPVLLKNLSFGQAAGYHAAGGLPVIDDASLDQQPVDLATVGLTLGTTSRLTAAFIRNHLAPNIRASFFRMNGSAAVHVRATSNGQKRIDEILLTFSDAGEASLDLPVQHLHTTASGIIDEQWQWETRQGDQWLPLHTTPVRIYLTTARPINDLPRESFYQVACAIPGATDQAAAKRNLWLYFCNPNGAGMHNARGVPLTMWKTATPTNTHNEYVCRKAQGLALHGDSSCLGWADLLKEAFAIHGIRSSIKYIWIDETQLDLDIPTFNVHKADGTVQTVREVGMIVKSYNWSTHGSIEAGITCGPNDVINAGDFRWKVNLIGNPVCLPWNSPDTTLQDQPGWLSWGANCYGIYCNHAVVLIENPDGLEEWYDPSHAIGPHSSLLNFQHDLLGTGLENSGGIFAVVGCRLRKQRNPITHAEEVLCVGEILCGAHPAPITLCLKACEPN